MKNKIKMFLGASVVSLFASLAIAQNEVEPDKKSTKDATQPKYTEEQINSWKERALGNCEALVQSCKANVAEEAKRRFGPDVDISDIQKSDSKDDSDFIFSPYGPAPDDSDSDSEENDFGGVFVP